MVANSKNRLDIAFVMQNSGVDLNSDIGQSTLVKQTVYGLQQAGHKVNLIALNGRSVLRIDDLSRLNSFRNISSGLSSTYPYMFAESGIRRVQRELRLPYFAFFDTYRFYEACCRCLPKYAVCHEYNGLFSLGAALACLRTGTPYVFTSDADVLLELAVVGKPLKGIHSLIASWEFKMIYKLAKKIICVSEPAKRHLIEAWAVDSEKIVVIPNGVDVELFGMQYDVQSIRNTLGLDREPVIGFVGGFQPWHGLDKLIEIFAYVVDKIPKARLLLVGDGPAYHIVEKKVAELGLGSVVIMSGRLPQKQVPEMLSVLDVAVAPYPRLPQELWFSPLKLYEYMAAGKAIVASRAGQIAEVIQDDRNGILVEPGDVAGFAQAIIKLLKSPAERIRLGQNAKQQAIRRHSWKQYTERLEVVYQDVLGNGERS